MDQRLRYPLEEVLDVKRRRVEEAERELARKKGDISTMTRCDELLGKYLALFTDKTELNTSDDIAKSLHRGR